MKGNISWPTLAGWVEHKDRDGLLAVRGEEIFGQITVSGDSIVYFSLIFEEFNGCISASLKFYDNRAMTDESSTLHGGRATWNSPFDNPRWCLINRDFVTMLPGTWKELASGGLTICTASGRILDAAGILVYDEELASQENSD